MTAEGAIASFVAVFAKFKLLAILMSLVVLSAVTVSAKDLTLVDVKQVLPNMERVGHEGESYKCAVKTEWLENGDLKVTATQQYKDWAPSTIEVVLAKVKGAYAYTEQYDDEITYKVEQSTLLSEVNDYRVDLYESFSFDIVNSKIVRFGLTVAEVDHENDPREDVIYCELE